MIELYIPSWVHHKDNTTLQFWKRKNCSHNTRHPHHHHHAFVHSEDLIGYENYISWVQSKDNTAILKEKDRSHNTRNNMYWKLAKNVAMHNSNDNTIFRYGNWSHTVTALSTLTNIICWGRAAWYALIRAYIIDSLTEISPDLTHDDSFKCLSHFEIINRQT